jgi:hypothetical protein
VSDFYHALGYNNVGIEKTDQEHKDGIRLYCWSFGKVWSLQLWGMLRLKTTSHPAFAAAHVSAVDLLALRDAIDAEFERCHVDVDAVRAELEAESK